MVARMTRECSRLTLLSHPNIRSSHQWLNLIQRFIIQTLNPMDLFAWMSSVRDGAPNSRSSTFSSRFVTLCPSQTSIIHSSLKSHNFTRLIAKLSTRPQPNGPRSTLPSDNEVLAFKKKTKNKQNEKKPPL
mgnify:CR=1 FL=1